MTGIHIGDDEKYLLTGATGFLGGHIMAGLLLKGKRLVLAGRASGTESLEGRVRKVLAWFGIEHLQGLLEFQETDFQQTRMGLGEDEYEKLCSRGLSIIHCASDTSFAEKDRAKVMTSNVGSLTEIVNFACKSNTRFFHFISSAYASGIDRVECTEVPVTSAAFTNVYEESKAKAEKIVSGRCREAELPYTIIRPSIIYGDSVTGRALKFNALYHPVRSLQLIRDIYLEDIENNNGIKAAECGIYINHDGVLHLPIRIFIPKEGKINLVPVDYFTETILSIVEKPVSETIYHITGNNSASMVRLASYTERFLNITGIQVVIGTDTSDLGESRNPPEEFFDHFIKAYRPYISGTRMFRRENTDRVTGGALPPDLSYEIFRRCMSFAVSVDWGKKLFC
jgi:nucleoside-diphosphate-sugar epimerase